MNPVALAASVGGLVALAELPDKTFLASLVLGARYRPLPVWFGVAGAFTVHVGIAIAAGSAVTLLSGRVRDGVVAALFLVSALALYPRRHDEEEELAAPGAAAGTARVVSTAFGLVFLAEFGDLTQVVTVDLAARYGRPIPVAIGALLGLWLVAALAVTAGARLLRRLPDRLLRLACAAVMLVLGVLSALAALR